LAALRVAQPQKSFRYRGADVDLQQAARELGVQAILTGRILLRGDTLVVKMNLVHADKDAQLWGQQFTKTMADIFVLQEEIADEVVKALTLTLAGEAKKRAPREQPRSSEAYHLYLKGRHHSAKRTAPNTTRALEFYQQAIDLDPTYAAAYAGIADCYAHLGFTPYGSMKPSDAYPLAKSAAQKALSLNDSLGDAYASLGMCGFFYDWDWTASERAFQRCLRLAPESLGARVWYPTLLAAIGRSDDAVQEARRAVAIDPLSVNAAAALAQVYYFTRRFDECSTALSRALEIDPHYPTAVVFVGFLHLARGNFAEGVAVLERTIIDIQHPHWLAHAGLAYGLAGRRQDALGIVDKLADLASRSYVSPISFAYVYQGLGDAARWREMMQAAFDERNGFLPLLDAPWNDPMRDHPFFAELRRKVGLPQPL
jgi:tetratricopeptide (TPR) repeat protein